MANSILTIHHTNEPQISGIFRQMPPIQYSEIISAHQSHSVATRLNAAISFTYGDYMLTHPFDVTELILSKKVARLGALNHHASRDALFSALGGGLSRILTVGAFVNGDFSPAKNDRLFRTLVPGLTNLLIGSGYAQASSFAMQFNYPIG